MFLCFIPDETSLIYLSSKTTHLSQAPKLPSSHPNPHLKQWAPNFTPLITTKASKLLLAHLPCPPYCRTALFSSLHSDLLSHLNSLPPSHTPTTP